MKQEKFKWFKVTANGKEYEVKTPQSKVTEKYFILNAWHYLSCQHHIQCAAGDVTSVVGLR